MSDLVVADVGQVAIRVAADAPAKAGEPLGAGDPAAVEPRRASRYPLRPFATERLGVEGRLQVLERQRVVEDVDIGDRVTMARKGRAGTSEQGAPAHQSGAAKARPAQKAGARVAALEYDAGRCEVAFLRPRSCSRTPV